MPEIKIKDNFEYYLMDDGNIRIQRYLGNESHVTVPDEFDDHPVTQIGMAAFKNNSDLQSVTLPKKLTYLGVCAFLFCNNLLRADLPETLKCIATGAFSTCDQLEELVIPKSTDQFGPGRVFPENTHFKLIVSPGSPAESRALSKHFCIIGKHGQLNVMKRMKPEEH